MSRSRFEFALEHAQPSDWQRFEHLASGFLASELSALRTVASPSGDAGRDAELFSPTGSSTIVLQYSVTKDWKAKIRHTAKRLTESLPATSLLIYVTNQAIGAQADSLKFELHRDRKLSLDIRDRSWFLDRYLVDLNREKSAEDFSSAITDPILASRDLIADKGVALDDVESRAAFVYLKLQWEDDSREKGLTKVCFDALVRCALRNTDSDNRLPREVINDTVCSFLPNHDRTFICHHVDQSLNRLTKKVVRHWMERDEFCLSHEERIRITNRILELQQSSDHILVEIRELIVGHGNLNDVADVYAANIEHVLEQILLKKGELFASSINTGEDCKSDI